jgi:hypothetical protein
MLCSLRKLPIALGELFYCIQVIVSKATYVNGWIYAIHLGFPYIPKLPYLSTGYVQTELNFFCSLWIGMLHVVESNRLKREAKIMNMPVCETSLGLLLTKLYTRPNTQWAAGSQKTALA